jgi:hypothetical protein
MESVMRLIVTAALMLTAFPAAASSTMCMFYAPPGAPVPDLEFLGYEELGGILIPDKGGPRRLPASSYRVLDLDQDARRIHLIYTNPDDPSLPPSFTLQSEDQHTSLTVLGDIHTGQFECGQW